MTRGAESCFESLDGHPLTVRVEIPQKERRATSLLLALNAFCYGHSLLGATHPLNLGLQEPNLG